MDLQDSNDSSPDSLGGGAGGAGGVENGGGAEGRGGNTLALPVVSDSVKERRHSIAPVLELVDGVNSATFDLLGDQSEDEGGEEGEEGGDSGDTDHWWGGHTE